MHQEIGLRERVADELLREACRSSVQTGFYRVRLVRGGPFVGALIDQGDAGWRTIVDGEAHDWHPDAALAPMLMTIWLHGTRVTEGEYHYRVSLANWARANDTQAPQAKPREVYDPNSARTIF